ncbi:MAG: DUF2252 domain-containing protein [Ilumatobacteraceae bacterium]
MTIPQHLSLEERRAIGRAARARSPRKGAGDWEPGGRGHDALRTVLAQNAVRAPDLVPIRHGRMAASPWTYFRGAAAVMAADLSSRTASGLRVQLCGDAHVLNFGLWATPERQLSFDLRDFDETLPGPFEWDVMRMAASVQVLAREAGLTGARAAHRAVAAALDGYRTGISRYAEARFLDVWYAQITADDLLSVVVGEDRADIAARLHRRARKRSNLGAAKKFTEVVDGRVRLVEARPFRARDDGADRAIVDEVWAAYRSSLPEERRYLIDRYSLVDVVRQVVGVGSVGMRVYLLLLVGARPDDLLFLQVKQAGPSVFEAFLEPSRYPNHGQRVTVGRRFIQSSTDIFVGWTRVHGIDFYVRQFRDMKVIPSSEQVAPWLPQFARKCGLVLARAHATTGDAAAIDAYVGKGQAFPAAIVRFAAAYALQNERDHSQLVEAVRDGEIASAPGW